VRILSTCLIWPVESMWEGAWVEAPPEEVCLLCTVKQGDYANLMHPYQVKKNRLL
jgi:hypothetical protein